ncbi:MAG TPA: DUF2203 domain-containing protein [Terriglobales bacterium]|jgi:hypothetical protein
MAQRTFTLDEAHLLLPVLESLLKQAIQAKKLVEQIDKEFQDLNHKIFLAGGLLINIAKVATRKAERERAVQKIKDTLSEIDATGVQVKDLDIGLLDFPCIVDEGIILLCWKLGEEKIAHWHSVEEGFKGRKPIDENILKQQKKRSN